jgi:ubiquinone/menaquinone biosynthesis C-methylase UbiE
MIAGINPEVRFIGLDLFEGMLDAAHSHAASVGIDILALRPADITKLDAFESASIDAILCTFSLHHLRDLKAVA